MTTENEIRTTLQDIRDPEIGRGLGELNMLGDIGVTDDGVSVTVILPTPAYPNRERIGEAMSAAVAETHPDAGTVNVKYDWNVRGKDAGGTIGLKVKNVVAVGSGKGGVGKSSLAAALAFGLKHAGAKVGLMDADVYGPSIPHMLGVTGQPATIEKTSPDGQTIQKIEPLEADGVKIMSMAFFVPAEKAVVWRGPLLHRAITQFLKDTDWGELDYLIIDMPPGTGDISLTLSQMLSLAGAVVVCTPQQVALLDAVKAISMFDEVKIPVLGIVENMTGEIFGRGGAKEKAAELGIPFLGEVPIDADIRIKGDAGRMMDVYAADSPSREALMQITEQVAIQIARQLLETPSLPTLEIL